jgi:hypothetical protein
MVPLVQQIYLKTLSVFKTGKAQTLASPTTTLGNTSVAHDLQSSIYIHLFDSFTCGSGVGLIRNG